MVIDFFELVFSNSV